jgi:hypothetical protein
MKDIIGAQITVCLELSLIVHAFMFIVSMTFGRHLQDICLPIAVLCQCVYTTSKRIEKDKAMFVGQEISGKTLGVVGLGQIGARVVDAALALGMNVVGYDPVLSVEAALMLPGDRMQVPSAPVVCAFGEVRQV